MSDLLKFADDTKLFSDVNTTQKVHQLQMDIDMLRQWSSDWQMPLNINKCRVIMHCGKNNPRNVYVMDGCDLQTVEQEKDLGILINDNLKSSVHCSQICKRANRMLGLIRRTIIIKDRRNMVLLYINH